MNDLSPPDGILDADPNEPRELPATRAEALALMSAENAPLPQAYENAKTSLSTCYSLNECQDWANKAAALVAYARLARDDTLINLAQRIQGRAIRRQGELLREIPDDNRGRPGKEIREGTLPNLSRTQAARDAGISDWGQKTAMRVSAIPEAEYERLMEGDGKPPTVTALAEIGRKPVKPSTPAKSDVDAMLPEFMRGGAYLGGRDPEVFKKATQFYAHLAFTTLREFREYDVPEIVGCLNEKERRDTAAVLAEIREIITNIEAEIIRHETRSH